MTFKGEKAILEALAQDDPLSCIQLFEKFNVSDVRKSWTLGHAISKKRIEATTFLLEYFQRQPTWNFQSDLYKWSKTAPPETLTLIQMHFKKYFSQPVLDRKVLEARFLNCFRYSTDMVKLNLKGIAILLTQLNLFKDKAEIVKWISDFELTKEMQNTPKILMLEMSFQERCCQLLETIAFGYVRHRATEICIALEELSLPALMTLLIVEEACYPKYAHPKMFSVWNLITTVKHFHQPMLLAKKSENVNK